MALTKVSGGILDPGISVAGIITATGFDGPFVGGTGDSINAGIITATGLDVNGNGDISGSLTVGSGGLDLNGSGDISGDLVVHGNLTANGDFTTLNTTLREVELLRVDANSNTTAGIITQRGSGDILRLYDTNAQIVTVADGGNVTLKSTNPVVNIQGTNASATAESNLNFLLRDGNSADRTIAKVTARNSGNGGYGALDFYTAFNNSNTKRMSISSGGDVTVETGSFAVTDPSEKIGIGLANPVKPLHIYTAGADSEIRLQTNSGTEQNSYISLRHATGDLDLFTVVAGTKMKFFTANTERLQITGTGQFHMGGTPGWTYASQKFVVVEPNNALGMILQGNNANQGVNLTLQNINNTVNAYSDISFADDGGQIIGAIRGKVVDRDNNHGEIQFHTSSGSLGQRAVINKDGKVGLGVNASNPSFRLQIHESDNTAYAANATVAQLAVGNINSSSATNAAGIHLFTDGNGRGVVNLSALNNSTSSSADFVIQTRHSGTLGERFKIKSDGKVLITNTLGLGGATSNPGDLLHAQSPSGEGKIVVMGATTGTVAISGLNGTSRVLFGDSSTENAGNITYTHSDDSLSFRVNGNTRWKFNSSGHFIPDSAGTYNIGNTSKEVGHIYVADSKTIWIGSDQDLRIAHDPTHTVSYIQNTGPFQIQTDDLRLYNFSTADLYLRATTNSSVQLFYDYSTYTTPKLETSATGITVDGEVAASQDYPNFRPTLDFNFAAQKKLDPRITFQRTGSASFTDKFGKVVLVGDNTPRFDHDPVTRESKGLLIEEQRTNLNAINTFRPSASGTRFSMNSADEQNAGENTNGVVSPVGTAKGVARAFFTGSETAPDGSVYLMASTSSSDGATFSNTNTYTSSVWIRTGLETVFKMQAHSQYASASAGGSASTIDFTFTLTGDGTVTTIESGGIAASVTKYPNNWYRCTLTYHRNSTSSVTSPYGVIVYPVNYASYNSNSVSGDIFWVWGPQVEEGAFPTSFIPTVGSNATRGQDLVEITEEEFSEFYNRTEGSFVGEIMLKPSFPVTGYASYMMTLSDGSYNNRVTLGSSTGSAAFNADVTIGGTNNRASLGSYTSGSYSIKAAIAYKASDSAGCLNGAAAVTTATSPGTLPLLTRADIGKDHGNFNPLNGHVKRIMYYQKRLSNNQLRTLTS